MHDLDRCIMLKNISVREFYAIVIRNVGRLIFFKKTFENFKQMLSNWMLQSKEFNPENSNTSAITLKQHASKQGLLGKITGN